ncbi:MAG: hypothetical protein D9V47_02565 [Clostridia bacterium]|nr:MAG: hypothetical protein D9V47_02565 [Clostridia bacterium]
MEVTHTLSIRGTRWPEFRLSPGQVLHARVLEVSGSEVLLLLAGRQVRAEARVPLEAGQGLHLEVVGRTPGASGEEILLRVLPAGTDTADLQDRLRAVAREMRLALPGPRVTELAALARSWGLAPAEIPALVWLAARGLPVTPENVGLVARAVSRPVPPPDVAAGTEALRELAASLPRGADNTLGVLDGLLDRITWAGGQPEEMAAALKELPGALGLNYEARLTELLAGDRHPAGTETRQMQEDNLKGWLLNLLRLVGDGGVRVQAGGVEVARDLLARLTHLQLLSQADQSLVFLGLVHLAGSQTPYLLKVGRQPEREESPGVGSGRGSGYNVTFLADLPWLGAVSGRLSLVGETLSCRLAVQKEAAQRLINSRLPELEAALESICPRVTVYPCVREAGVVREVAVTEFGHYLAAAGIDVRV